MPLIMYGPQFSAENPRTMKLKLIGCFSGKNTNIYFIFFIVLIFFSISFTLHIALTMALSVSILLLSSLFPYRS